MITAEERESIRESFARLLTDSCSEADVRRIAESASGYDPQLWKAMSDMGLPALIVPSDDGGIGAGALEVAAVMETAGTALLPSPFFASSILATSLIAGSNDADAKARLLSALADGSRIASLALTGEQGTWEPDGIAVNASDAGGSWILHGLACYVLYGLEADVLLVAANGRDGVAVFEVDPAEPGVAREAQSAFDRTQRLARISFNGVPATLIDGGGAQLDHSLELGRVALAAEQAGAARRLFDMTIEYIRTRVQFGRPIGGFQAIKHMAADLLIEVESCTSAAREAAMAVAEQRPDRAAAVTLAAFACSECFSKIAFDAIQMHGGIGFTWEYPAHLYLRRARATAELLGSPTQLRERYISILEQTA